jgi:glyoxylase-like metal-dependent hydrolase (beta-lactamase superfamily II)
MTRTRKILLALAAVAVAVVAPPVALLVATFAGNPPIVDGRELPGGGRVVKDGYVSLAVVDVGPGHVLLVDAGGDPKGAAIDAELSRRGLGRDAVLAILLTHGHADHTGACGLFPNATVYALEAELPLLEGKVAPKGPLPRLFGASASSCAHITPIHDGEKVDVGQISAEVFAVPGHTAGSAAWLVTGALYLGDAADATKDGRLVGSKWVFSDDAAQDERSLVALAGRVEGLPISTLVFAHTGTLEGVAPLKAFADQGGK